MCIHQHELDSFPIYKDFSDEIGSDMIFLIECHEMCQQLEELQKSVNHYFPNNQFPMGQNLAWVKHLFRVLNKLMNFSALDAGRGQGEYILLVDWQVGPRQSDAPPSLLSLECNFCPLFPH